MSNLKLLSKHRSEGAQKILQQAMDEQPDEVLVVVFKGGSYSTLASASISRLHQVGALRSLEYDIFKLSERGAT